MTTHSLRLTAARYVLGRAKTLELAEAADAALNRGVYTDSLGRLATTDGLVFDEAGPLFENALEALAIPLPGREEGIRTLLLDCIGAIAEEAVPPHAGLTHLVKDLYYPFIETEPVSRYAGDSRGIETLLGYYWGYDDLLERPREVSFAGKYGPEALAEWGRSVVGLAGDWIRERGGVAVEPSWLAWNGGTVVRLAQCIAGERRFTDLSVLADALEEAGCGNRDILAHCREAGPHTVRCWAVDAVLGWSQPGHSG